MNRVRDLLDRAPRQTSSAPALLEPDCPPLGYAALSALIDKTSTELGSRGIGRDDRIALVLASGPELLTAFLAVSSCAACAPLNPAYREEELRFFLGDLQPRLAIVGAGLNSPAIDAARTLGIPVAIAHPESAGCAGLFRLEDGPGSSRGADAAAVLSPPPDQDTPALLLHTSGTTSRPKLVALTHRNLLLSASRIGQTLELSEADRYLNVMPLFHVHGLLATLATLATGGTVICPSSFDGSRFFGWIAELGPTWYSAVPTIHQTVLARADRHHETIARHRLRFIRSGSAALPVSVMKGLEDAFRVPVVEFYGMTEASNQMTINPLPPGIRKPGSVGRPAGPDMRVVDDRGQSLGAGRSGEVVIQGGTVIQAYAGLSSTNDGAFFDGWLRTGDSGHFDEDGYLYLDGRLKEIINRGGEKISPREIEERLLEHPDIVQAAAFAIPDDRLGEDIGAVIVLHRDSSLDSTAVREWLSTRIADFKIPRAVRIVDAIPVGPTGKVRRLELATTLGFDAVVHALKPAVVEPRSVLEAKLAALWRDVLGLESVGVQDDFFAVGGDSLMAVTLLARAASALGIEVSVVRFLDAPTVAGMAEFASRPRTRERDAARVPGLVPIQPDGTRPALFCAPGHEGGLVGFAHLARHLGADQPVFGLAPSVLDDPPTVTIEDLAARHVRQVRALQPSGPYLLAGVCFGGFIAFEMARRLRDEGQEVALLAMLDSFNPNGHDAEAGLLSRVFERAARKVWFHAANIRAAGSQAMLPYLNGRLRALIGEVRARAGQAVYDSRVGSGRRPPVSPLTPRYAARRVLGRYVPRPYSGSAVLFQVPYMRPAANQMGWAGIIEGPVHIHAVPFHPDGLLAEPIAALVADRLRARLADLRWLPASTV